MFEPLLMSKQVFDALPQAQRDAVMAVGADMEGFAQQSAKKDDQDVAAIYQKAGAKVVDLNAATIRKWQDIARRTAWKAYGARNEGSATLLALAEKTL